MALQPSLISEPTPASAPAITPAYRRYALLMMWVDRSNRRNIVAPTQSAEAGDRGPSSGGLALGPRGVSNKTAWAALSRAVLSLVRRCSA